MPVAGFAGAEPGVVAAVDGAIEQLAQLGCQIAVAESPTDDDLDLANAVGLVISRCEAAACTGRWSSTATLYWEEVARAARVRGAAFRAVDYLDAQRIRLELRDRLLRGFDRCDVLAMPTAPVVAPPVDDFARYLMLLARNAIPWSFVGFPALSSPWARARACPWACNSWRRPAARPC